MITKDYIAAKAGSEVLACVGFSETLDRLDFASMNSAIEAMHEVEVLGEAGYSVEGSTATIKVRGLLVPDLGYDLSDFGITGYDVIQKYLENADEDPLVEQAVLDIDSGGGFVSGLHGAVVAIENFSKPISAHATGDAYSAAYWLASTPDGLTASEGSGIGSIGVYVEHFDRSRELEADGIKSTIFKSGFWKGAFSSFRPLSEREATRLQNDVDETAKAFFDHVADKRGLTTRVVERLDGDYFRAERALSLGLIDAITENIMVNGNSTAAAVQAPVAVEGMITKADAETMVSQAVAKALADAKEEADKAAKAAAERRDAIASHSNGTDEVKAVLTGEAFAGVEVAQLTAILDAMPQSDIAALEAAGGAGIGADRKEFAPKTESDEKAAKAAEALAALSNIKTKVM